MKDANPHIFRSLEKVSGPGEFDTIVSAAVASYGALRSPSETQARDFARLVTPLWDKLLPETKRTLGAALSKSSRVPREIVDRILAEPIEIAAPFLVSSPVLSETDRLPLRKTIDSKRQPDATLHEPKPRPSVAGTQGTPVAPEPAAPPTSKRAIAASRPQPALDARPAPFEPGAAAASVRETLRRMVRPGGTAQKASRRTVTDLVEMAVHRENEAAYATIAEMAGIDDAVCARIAGEESGEFLAVALKALGLGPADALTVLMMLKPRIGLDTAVFNTMARYYRALKREDCALLLGGRRRVEAPALQPQFEDIESADRPAARPTFGRRSTRPGLPETKARSA